MFKKSFVLLAAGLCLLLSGCMPHSNSNRHVSGYSAGQSLKNYSETGVASWYGKRFNRRRTSSGERYNMYAMTAAHKTLPLSTYVRVTNLINGKQVVVKINDRGPFIRHRVIDLSYAAAKKLGMVSRGTARVAIKAV